MGSITRSIDAAALVLFSYVARSRVRAMRFLCGEASGAQRLLFGFAFAPIRRAMTQMMDIHPGSAEDAERRFLIALDKLENALAHRGFRVGDRFSRADSSACALLWPLCRPGESESKVQELLPEAVCNDASQTRAAGSAR